MQFRQPFAGDYPITLDYGEKFPPLYTDESPHRGIDYGCPTGTPILASEEGIVIFVAHLTQGYGNFVLISHTGTTYETLYAHLDSISVKVNDIVCKGDVIGYSGNSGNSTGPHLHFEVRKSSIQIDPKTVLHSVFTGQGYNSTPVPEKPEFEPVRSGFCTVVCDVANVRCHCDMSRVIGTRKKGDVISIADEITMYNGLPYRDYYDPEYKCWLRIAEHDPYTQMLRNKAI